MYPSQYLPSTTTLQAHSAFPDGFSAMHLYSPPFSGVAFSMVSEQSVPVQKRERSNACYAAVHKNLSDSKEQKASNEPVLHYRLSSLLENAVLKNSTFLEPY